MIDPDELKILKEYFVLVIERYHLEVSINNLKQVEIKVAGEIIFTTDNIKHLEGFLTGMFQCTNILLSQVGLRKVT